jgi:hypothetical protein
MIIITGELPWNNITKMKQHIPKKGLNIFNPFLNFGTLLE